MDTFIGNRDFVKAKRRESTREDSEKLLSFRSKDNWKYGTAISLLFGTNVSLSLKLSPQSPKITYQFNKMTICTLKELFKICEANTNELKVIIRQFVIELYDLSCRAKALTDIAEIINDESDRFKLYLIAQLFGHFYHETRGGLDYYYKHSY
ncbi:Hypothetical protein HVR_LOCUS731 [uncultured virus]|nr:Hypothetical protein HVR_LOCUS731 [uncultured virus]